MKLDIFNELFLNFKIYYLSEKFERKKNLSQCITEIQAGLCIDLYYSIDNIKILLVNGIKGNKFSENFELNLTYETFYLDPKNPVFLLKR